jgi:hypothetical protein
MILLFINRKNHVNTFGLTGIPWNDLRHIKKLLQNILITASISF